jgi:hypothetical protein
LKPIGGAFGPRHATRHRLGAMQHLEAPMRHYSGNEAVDFLVVGVGAAGGVLMQRLARAGFRIVGLEAGPFWDTERDWVSDEAGSSFSDVSRNWCVCIRRRPRTR